MNLSAIDNHGNLVDWWFLYKVAGNSTCSNGCKPAGTEYVYFDPTVKENKLVLLPEHIEDPKAGGSGEYPEPDI
jgi:hypothetical protein